MAEYQAVGLGQGLRGIVDVIQIIRRVDFAKLQELMAKLAQLRQIEDIVEKVTICLDALVIIAEMTPTDTDDKIVAAIKGVMTPELIKVIADLVEQTTEQRVMDATAIAAAQAKAEQAGIPWIFIVQIAMQIVQLLIDRV
jgi:hypothetical protein